MRRHFPLLTLLFAAACDPAGQASVDPQLLRAAEQGDLSPAAATAAVTERDAAVALDLATRADAVFAGEVVAIEYQVSEPDEDGRRLPFTYVTWYVEEGIKGVESGQAFTARFLGGPMDDRSLVVTEYPHFQMGDRDLLFVANNGEVGCPLVAGAHGRIPVAVAPASGVAASPRAVTWHEQIVERLYDEVVDEGEAAPSVEHGVPFTFDWPRPTTARRRAQAAADFRARKEARTEAASHESESESESDAAERAALEANDHNPVLR